MIIGIVGSEEAKFTPATKAKALEVITHLVRSATKVVSGGCYLGGIDKWAIEVAEAHDTEYQEFLPKHRRWSGGYRERNIQIAEASDMVVCITVKRLPPGYKGMRFSLCYHCGKKDHVKSGGCWTVKYAKSRGKKTKVIIL